MKIKLYLSKTIFNMTNRFEREDVKNLEELGFKFTPTVQPSKHSPEIMTEKPHVKLDEAVTPVVTISTLQGFIVWIGKLGGHIEINVRTADPEGALRVTIKNGEDY